MITITLTRHEFNFSELSGLARKERRPWIRKRIKAIAAVRAGVMSREAIARKFHTDSDQVRLWIQRYNTEGLNGLEDKPGRGAKRVLTPRQEVWLKKALQKSPRKSGVATNLWSGKGGSGVSDKEEMVLLQYSRNIRNSPPIGLYLATTWSYTSRSRHQSAKAVPAGITGEKKMNVLTPDFLLLMKQRSFPSPRLSVSGRQKGHSR